MKKSEVIGAVAMANESAALTLLRRVYTGLACAALTQIPNGERLWNEIGEYLETRAAALPGAEAVTLTDDQRAAIKDAYDRLTTLGFPEILPVMRNLRGLLDAPQPAQADAPAHAAECPHCDGEGVIEGDSGTSPCACQMDVQEGMPTFGPRKVQAYDPARAMTREDEYLIKWLGFISQDPFERDPSSIARRLLRAKATEEEKRLVAELIDKWARAYVKRFPK